MAAALLFLTVAPAEATTIHQQSKADPRFGVNQAWENGPAADTAGAGWSRLVFWWSAFEPNGPTPPSSSSAGPPALSRSTPNGWNYFATDNDSYIKAELGRGRELTGVVMSVPRWAATAPSPGAVPKNLYLPWDSPQNYWGAFMKQLAQMYAGRIDKWIIWNEVDIPSGEWKTWEGSVEDYVQLMKVAYRAVKAGNPRAQIAHYGSPWWYDHGEYLTHFLDLLAVDPEAPRYNYYFDIGDLHLYSRAADIARVIPWYRDQLAQRGIPPKPIMIGETNAIPYDDPIWPADKAGFRVSQDEQASYMVEALATYVALGVERVGINRLRDGEDFKAGGEPFGLLRNDGSRRPAYTAFAVGARYFAGAQPASYQPPGDDGVTVITMILPGQRITVAWTLKPSPGIVRIEAISSAGLLVGKFGNSAPVQPDGDGLYRFDLAGATANSNETDPLDYVVGGNPLILIERSDGGTPNPLAI